MRKTKTLKHKIYKYLKKNQGVKIYHLEDMAGVSRGTIYRHMTKGRGISLGNLQKILSIIDP
jgi:DeoR/GlpR family transcriptional regulator of sugar metabolism